MGLGIWTWALLGKVPALTAGSLDTSLENTRIRERARAIKERDKGNKTASTPFVSTGKGKGDLKGKGKGFGQKGNCGPIWGGKGNPKEGMNGGFKGAWNLYPTGAGYQGICWGCGEIGHKSAECPWSVGAVEAADQRPAGNQEVLGAP